MKPSTRRKARRLALQALYQWHLTQATPDEIKSQLLTNCNPKKVDLDYCSELITGVIANTTTLDQQMEPFLDRPLRDLNPVELTILRMSIYELIYRLDIPYKVIINEALELAKAFGAEASFKYINGILDQVVKNLNERI